MSAYDDDYAPTIDDHPLPAPSVTPLSAAATPGGSPSTTADPLSVAPVRVEVPFVKKHPQGHYIFTIHVEGEKQSQWAAVHRRYSDFVKLDSQLRNSGSQPPLPLPAKILLLGRIGTAMVERRRQNLEGYLQALLASEDHATSRPFLSFIGAFSLGLAETDGLASFPFQSRSQGGNPFAARGRRPPLVSQRSQSTDACESCVLQ